MTKWVKINNNQISRKNKNGTMTFIKIPKEDKYILVWNNAVKPNKNYSSFIPIDLEKKDHWIFNKNFIKSFEMSGQALYSLFESGDKALNNNDEMQSSKWKQEEIKNIPDKLDVDSIKIVDDLFD